MGSFLPPDFMFGFATAAAQIEGGGPESERLSGRGLSIWDAYCKQPGAITDGTSIMRTCNHLDMYKSDIALMKSLGVNAYRFSISWPRIIPDGGRVDPLNRKGIAFYNNVINTCLDEGITPLVTLHHWDLPQTLRDRYGGWLNKDEVVADYLRYVDICFDAFGDRVKHWLTFNEPWRMAAHGHGDGKFAPGVQSDTEPWIVGHSVLVAHARAVQLYNSKYRTTQKGCIGITLNCDWAEPFDQSPENIEAAQSKLDTQVGWFADPVYLGRYPQSMVDRLGDRLPQFTLEESSLLKGSSDFFGLNTYTTNTIKAGDGLDIHGGVLRGFDTPDALMKADLDWLRCVPWGFRKLLNYLWKKYQVPIYVTENGWCSKGESGITKSKAVSDQDRVDYFEGYLNALREAMVLDEVDVRSYFAWSFMDNFEWNTGLEPRFGCVYMDYSTFERTPKQSAMWLKEFFSHNATQVREV